MRPELAACIAGHLKCLANDARRRGRKRVLREIRFGGPSSVYHVAARAHLSANQFAEIIHNHEVVLDATAGIVKNSFENFH